MYSLGRLQRTITSYLVELLLLHDAVNLFSHLNVDSIILSAALD